MGATFLKSTTPIHRWEYDKYMLASITLLSNNNNNNNLRESDDSQPRWRLYGTVLHDLSLYCRVIFTK